jgi:acetylornithine/N-succinyldiaminopimelate aminotransferase
MQNAIIPFYQPSDKLIVRSKDCSQFDTEGKRYIDFDSGVWCTNLGHSNNRIVWIIEEQAKMSIHHGYRFRNVLSEKLSVELLDILSIRGGQSAFLSSGSEAVNLAITLAKRFTGRQKVLKMDLSYLSAFGHGHISDLNTDLLTVPMNDSDALRTINFSEIAAFVFEPGTAFGTIHFPSAQFIQEIVERTKEKGVLLIADEVTCGFGRTGKWFGFQHYNFTPDVVATGKALGNGYPVSAVSITAEMARWFNQNPLRYAQSHQNDPLGCAIGLEVIRTIQDEDLISRANKTGRYFREKLINIQEKHPDKIKEIRSRGLMLALELFPKDDGEKLHNDLFEQGFIVGFRNNVLRFMPPLTIEVGDIDSLSSALEEWVNKEKRKSFSYS